jgi:Ubiquitin elongating factor core
MLLNDAQYLVDEILVKLKEIKKTAEEMQDQERWNQMDAGIL